VRQPRVIDKLHAAGRYGQKTGSGWYRYDEKRTPQADPEVDALIATAAKESGIVQRKIISNEIVERTVYAIVNEAARILEEGFALRASDIDMVFINGYGFPVYRGGPMHFADSVGLKSVYEKVIEFQRLHGAAWEPAPLFQRLAEANESFSTLDAQREANVATG
jgi:3-hydroxyacyl-CoA dehydrogenase